MDSVPVPMLSGAGRQAPALPLDAAPARQLPAAVAACTVLAGTLTSLIGISWDVEWHVDVGPDTFFTLSHLMLYSGSALAGLVSLVMVLRATSAQRAGRAADTGVGGSPVRVFGGAFTAPLGYLVAGSGAALFLLYGLMDLWWHSLYGFDAVLDSPPHVALFISISLTMVGSIIVFVAARDQRWGRIGLVVSIPVLMTFCPLTTYAFQGLSRTVDPQLAGNIFFSVCLTMTGALALRRRGIVLAIAVVLGAMQLFLWWFSPWAAKTYAGHVGLPLRDNLMDMAPVLPSGIPMFMIVVALVIEGLLLLGRRQGWSGRRLPQLVGAVGGVLVSLSILLQNQLVSGGSDGGGGGPMGQSGTTAGTVLIDAVLGLAFGTLAGFLAARFAVLLRLNTPATDQEES
ncbi:hypothetical protein SUDANB145_06344 [Streptomyces sp. enrichment culture]|uniref:hypothetical protein n=1 Tax=Streptomyces sp. enrichment culture TaxID=1795815 RepID=UPI003F5681A1